VSGDDVQARQERALFVRRHEHEGRLARHPRIPGLGIPGDDGSAWLPLRQRSDSRIAFTIAALFSSTYEEVAFRAYLQARLQEWMPRARFLPVLLSAGAFSLAHGYSPLASIGVYVTGLLLGFAYRRWRRIPRLAVAHWFFNVMTVWV
jgi:membrane protease YdiL (CAAX protease family)